MKDEDVLSLFELLYKFLKLILIFVIIWRLTYGF